MENTTNKKETAKKTTSNKTTPKKEVQPKQTIVKQEIKKFGMDELIKVVSLQVNNLIYLSKTQVGFQVEWDEYGSEQWIEYRELITMKNSQTAFFKNNWIICDLEVLQSLRVDQYYKNMIDLDNIEGIFSNKTEELEQIISTSSDGIKQLIFDKALQMYKEDRLDSIKIVAMLKDKFDYDLELVK